ncbi:MAG: hypothetical protein QM539_00410 [Alphaproteobacteria bacterium]|nr:hypothetical protein [Alphaproteobacteria bacterium]
MIPFDDVVGYKQQKQQFIDIIKHQKLGHAYLFLSKEGGGALKLGVSLATWIVCLPEQINEETFQNIPSKPQFYRAQNYIHPDLHFCFPTVNKSDKKKSANTFMAEWRQFLESSPCPSYFDWLNFIDAENKQGKITAEDCDDIAAQVVFKPFDGIYKVWVIWLPELMGKEGNKLLKILEEPPEHTIFILICEDEHSLLDTIKSRCQMITLPKYTETEVFEALSQKFHCDPILAKRISYIANGNLNKAISLTEDVNPFELQLIRNWLNQIYQFKQDALQECINGFHEIGREKQKHALTYFLFLIELSIKQGYLPAEEVFFNTQEQDFVMTFNKLADPVQKETIAKLINNYIYYIERNAYAKTCFMTLSIQLHYILRKKEQIFV